MVRIIFRFRETNCLFQAIGAAKPTQSCENLITKKGRNGLVFRSVDNDVLRTFSACFISVAPKFY